jgi:hypothetical protein
MQAVGSLQAVLGFRVVLAPITLTANGRVSADVLSMRGIQAAMNAASSALINLNLVPSTTKQIGSQLLSGAGGGTSRLGAGLAALAALASSGSLSINLRTALGSSARLTGAGGTVINVALLPGASALDLANSNSSITLSNNNRTATWNAPSGSGCVRGTKSNSSGQLYFEVTVNAFGTTIGGGNMSVGVCIAAFAITSATYVGSDSNSGAITDKAFGSYIDYSGGTAGTTLSPGPQPGDVIMVAVDLTTSPGFGVVRFGVNGIWVKTGTTTFPNVLSYDSNVASPLYPAVSVDSTNSINASLTINTGGSAFAYTPPSGYSAWG